MTKRLKTKFRRNENFWNRLLYFVSFKLKKLDHNNFLGKLSEVAFFNSVKLTSRKATRLGKKPRLVPEHTKDDTSLIRAVVHF